MKRLDGRAHRESAGGADCQGASPCIWEMLLFAAPLAALAKEASEKIGKKFCI